MVKNTQTIRRQFADELFECVWPFCNLAFKGLRKINAFHIDMCTDFDGEPLVRNNRHPFLISESLTKHSKIDLFQFYHI